MKKGFFARVMRVLDNADIVLEVLDARFPELTRHAYLERFIHLHNKKLVLVLNKSDLAELKSLQAYKRSIPPSLGVVFLSSTQRKGISRVRNLLSILSSQMKRKPVKVAVIGYPNCGKSSLINALRGRHIVGTSSRAGFTRGQQLVRLTDDLFLIDSPGVIPLHEQDEFFLSLVAAKTQEQLKDPEQVALKLIDFVHSTNPIAISKAFGVELTQTDPYEILCELALKKNKVLRGHEPDVLTMARQLISKWQKGLIHV